MHPPCNTSQFGKLSFNRQSIPDIRYSNLPSISTQKNNPQVHILPSKSPSFTNQKKRKISFVDKIESFVINKFHIDTLYYF